MCDASVVIIQAVPLSLLAFMEAYSVGRKYSVGEGGREGGREGEREGRLVPDMGMFDASAVIIQAVLLAFMEAYSVERKYSERATPPSIPPLELNTRNVLLTSPSFPPSFLFSLSPFRR